MRGGLTLVGTVLYPMEADLDPVYLVFFQVRPALFLMGNTSFHFRTVPFHAWNALFRTWNVLFHTWNAPDHAWKD